MDMHIVQTVNPRLSIQELLQQQVMDANKEGYEPSKGLKKLILSKGKKKKRKLTQKKHKKKMKWGRKKCVHTG